MLVLTQRLTEQSETESRPLDILLEIRGVCNELSDNVMQDLITSVEMEQVCWNIAINTRL